MKATKTITITCDNCDKSRRVRLTTSVTAAQLLRQVGLSSNGALIHGRSTIDKTTGLTIQRCWIARDKPYKDVVAGDVLRAVQFDPNTTSQTDELLEPHFNPHPPASPS